MTNELKKYFEEKYYRNKNNYNDVIVHCPTKDLAIKFMNIANDLSSFYWDRNAENWNEHGVLTGYCINRHYCCNVSNYYGKSNYNVVVFTEDDYNKWRMS